MCCLVMGTEHLKGFNIWVWSNSGKVTNKAKRKNPENNLSPHHCAYHKYQMRWE